MFCPTDYSPLRRRPQNHLLSATTCRTRTPDPPRIPSTPSAAFVPQGSLCDLTQDELELLVVAFQLHKSEQEMAEGTGRGLQ
jgi:hypothetical protein